MSDQHNNRRTPVFLLLRQLDFWSADIQLLQSSPNVRVPRCLHRVFNAPLDKNALKLAEIQVFERCLKYGTSPDYTRKKKAEEPEMILNIKLAA